MDLATGEAQETPADTRDPAAVALGRKGGLKGGKARAAKMTRLRSGRRQPNTPLGLVGGLKSPKDEATQQRHGKRVLAEAVLVDHSLLGETREHLVRVA